MSQFQSGPCDNSGIIPNRDNELTPPATKQNRERGMMMDQNKALENLCHAVSAYQGDRTSYLFEAAQELAKFWKAETPPNVLDDLKKQIQQLHRFTPEVEDGAFGYCPKMTLDERGRWVFLRQVEELIEKAETPSPVASTEKENFGSTIANIKGAISNLEKNPNAFTTEFGRQMLVALLKDAVVAIEKAPTLRLRTPEVVNQIFLHADMIDDLVRGNRDDRLLKCLLESDKILSGLDQRRILLDYIEELQRHLGVTDTVDRVNENSKPEAGDKA